MATLTATVDERHKEDGMKKFVTGALVIMGIAFVVRQLRRSPSFMPGKVITLD